MVKRAGSIKIEGNIFQLRNDTEEISIPLNSINSLGLSVVPAYEDKTRLTITSGQSSVYWDDTTEIIADVYKKLIVILNNNNPLSSWIENDKVKHFYDWE